MECKIGVSLFFMSCRRRHTRCALVTGVQTCALPISRIYNTDFMLRLAGHVPAPLRARAFELSLRAAALDPANGHVHSRLAWCYLRRGDAAQAVRRFDEAVEIGPHHADGLNEAGFGLCQIGRAHV